MKRTILLFAAVTMLMAAPSCTKKGENDPFISFMTRDARITGTWQLTELTSTTTNTQSVGGSISINTTSSAYNGTLLTTVFGGSANSILYSEEITINKDGTYLRKVVNDLDTYENTGHWWWLDDKKKKTRIAFDDDWNSLEIDQLKNKELIVTQNETSKSSYVGGDFDEDVYEYTATYSKK